MKLLRLKLLSPFRGLQKGFEIKFNSSSNDNSFQPICFVGQNGCGKSNVLEVLSEIFYELELMHLDYTIDDEEAEGKNEEESGAYGYELEYILPFEAANNLEGTGFQVDEYVTVKIMKKPSESPAFYKLNKSGEYQKETDRNGRRMLLPTKIIGYSSGMNELISSPYVKMRLNYFNEYEMNIKSDIKAYVQDSRMFYMDYETNSIILIANYLIHDNEKLDVVNEILNVRKLHSFRIVVRLLDYSGEEIDKSYNIYKGQSIEEIINKLKKCATCYNDELLSDKKTITLDFFASKATQEAFKYYFQYASELYKVLYLLNSLNVFAISPRQRNKIIKCKSASTMEGLIPKTTEDEQIFRIENILLYKNGVEEPLRYKKFSDGEHQLMQTIGAVLLMNDPGILFLMDEPETHFNPQWRSKFVSALNKITGNEGTDREQELILTTHSPFILSDCQTQNIYKFIRSDGIVKAENPMIHTYGTSFSILYKEILDKENTVSDLVAESIEKLKNEYIETSEDIDRIKDEVMELGESAEKFFLLSYLNKRKKQIDSKDDGK